MDGTPYPPPYGRHTAATDKVAANLGYATITMWSADIGDWRPENETRLIANAQKSFQPQQIVSATRTCPP